MSEVKLREINEYIFAPFNTYIYLDYDEIRFSGLGTVKKKLIGELNSSGKKLPGSKLLIKWSVEDSEDFKLSKGVFAPPGKDNSFIMAEIRGSSTKRSAYPIRKKIAGSFPAGSMRFENVRFYFHIGGVATCSAMVRISRKDDMTVEDLEKISESLNDAYKEYFEGICYELTEKYVTAVRKLGVPHFAFEFMPNYDEVDRSKNYIPWTHRIYHIHDDSLFELEAPGEPFRHLLTPSWHMDIRDFSIYDNRYVYFGWGHSLILTTTQKEEYAQTTKPIYDYVRLVEIAQVNWQCIDILTDIVDVALVSFNRQYKTMRLSAIQRAMDNIRQFENGVHRVLDYARGVKITFDTENRHLLKELHKRWLTEQMVEKLRDRLEVIQDYLEQLYQRQKRQRDESLNKIVLLFTILGIAEVFGVIFAILQAYRISPIAQLATLGMGTIVLTLTMIMYLRYAEKG